MKKETKRGFRFPKEILYDPSVFTFISPFPYYVIQKFSLCLHRLLSLLLQCKRAYSFDSLHNILICFPVNDFFPHKIIPTPIGVKLRVQTHKNKTLPNNTY